MGSCNCGHLAQVLTQRSRAEIHRLALEKAGDWGQQAVEHCPVSGLPMDHILTTMMDAGMTDQDINDLERLASTRVRRSLGTEGRSLDYRRRSDVVTYMRAWANLLAEEQWGGLNAPAPEIDRLARAGEVRSERAATDTSPEPAHHR